MLIEEMDEDQYDCLWGRLNEIAEEYDLSFVSEECGPEVFELAGLPFWPIEDGPDVYFWAASWAVEIVAGDGLASDPAAEAVASLLRRLHEDPVARQMVLNNPACLPKLLAGKDSQT